MIGFCNRCNKLVESTEGFECSVCQSSLRQVDLKVESEVEPKAELEVEPEANVVDEKTPTKLK